MNTTATICLTIIAVAAIAGAVMSGYANVETIAATLGTIASGCIGGIAGYTIASKSAGNASDMADAMASMAAPQELITSVSTTLPAAASIQSTSPSVQ
jgi:hypothetical protein